MYQILTVLTLIPCMALAADPEFNLTIKDHRFEPAQLRVPAGKKIKLLIENKDDTAEEFESHALNREKVVPARAQVTVFIGPLGPGQYPFAGEFHENTAQGVIIVQ
jgi:plastocyanin